MCVVVVVEIDSDVIVCALSSTPALPPALPSNCKGKKPQKQKKKGIFVFWHLKALFSQEKKLVFLLNTFFSSVRTEI